MNVIRRNVVNLLIEVIWAFSMIDFTENEIRAFRCSSFVEANNKL